MVFNFLAQVSVSIITIIVLFYKWATQNDLYFKKRGVPALKPVLFFGNSADFFTKKVDLIDFVKKLYNDFPDKKYDLSLANIFGVKCPCHMSHVFQNYHKNLNPFPMMNNFPSTDYLDFSTSCDQHTCCAILSYTNTSL